MDNGMLEGTLVEITDKVTGEDDTSWRSGLVGAVGHIQFFPTGDDKGSVRMYFTPVRTWKASHLYTSPGTAIQEDGILTVDTKNSIYRIRLSEDTEQSHGNDI